MTPQTRLATLTAAYDAETVEMMQDLASFWPALAPGLPAHLRPDPAAARPARRPRYAPSSRHTTPADAATLERWRGHLPTLAVTGPDRRAAQGANHAPLVAMRGTLWLHNGRRLASVPLDAPEGVWSYVYNALMAWHDLHGDDAQPGDGPQFTL